MAAWDLVSKQAGGEGGGPEVSSQLFLFPDECMQKSGLPALVAHQQLFTDLVEYVGKGRRLGSWLCTHASTHSVLWEGRTSAEARDVTSIRFSARNANTAAARTGGRGGLLGEGVLRERGTQGRGGGEAIWGRNGREQSKKVGKQVVIRL